METNPYTFLHVINPEFSMQEEKSEPYSLERCVRSREKLEEFISEGIMFRDEKETLYLYRQSNSETEYVGLIAGASVDEYDSGKIKKHEETITQREKHFTKYLQVVECNAEPVLLFHRHHEKLEETLEQIMRDRPEYEFTTTQKIKHEVWLIQDEKIISEIQRYYEDIDSVYIADGHHRCASSSRYSKEVNAKKDGFRNYFMAYFISEVNMGILDYNRIVKDLNGLSKQEFIRLVKENFEVTELGEHAPNCTSIHQIMMYLDKKWYLLNMESAEFDPSDSVGQLDTNILTVNLLRPILGIQDLKTDARISFVAGYRGLEGIEEKIDSGDYEVGFVLFPVSVEQLKTVADEGRIMPPKSTWIEPKLRSGLTMYPLNDD